MKQFPQLKYTVLEGAGHDYMIKSLKIKIPKWCFWKPFGTPDSTVPKKHLIVKGSMDGSWVHSGVIRFQ